MWSSPLFQRLQFVRQLSSVSQFTFLDASHSRLSHCFGTVDIATMILNALVGKAVEEKGASKTASMLTQRESIYTAFLLAAGCHDLFHGPIGHSLDAVTNLLFNEKSGSEKSLDKLALGQRISEAKHLIDSSSTDNFPHDAHPLLLLVEHAAPTNQDRREVFEFFAAILKNKDYMALGCDMIGKYGPEISKILSALANLLDSDDLDIDRIDYLYRDSVHLGRPELCPNIKDIASRLDISFGEDLRDPV